MLDLKRNMDHHLLAKALIHHMLAQYPLSESRNPVNALVNE